MTPLKIALILVFSLVGGFLSRWHGGGFISGSPKFLKNSLWSAPLAGIAAYAVHSAGHDWPWIVGAFVLSFTMCFLGKTTGHGQWFLYRMVRAISPERLDFLVKPFWGQDPRTFDKYSDWQGGAWWDAPKEISPQIAADMDEYGLDRLYWRNVTGMGIVGLAAVSGLVVVLSFTSPLSAVIAGVGGVLKAPSYMIGDALLEYEEKDGDFDEPTELGEALTGVFAYMAAGISFILI